MVGLGIDPRRWPSRGGPAPAGPALDHPVLYLVDPGCPPPACGELEDWIRYPLDRDELVARSNRLVERGRERGANLVHLDDDDVLRVGDRLAILSRQEARLVRALLGACGHVVVRDELVLAVWPDGAPTDPRALDNRLRSVRERLAGLPLRIHTVRGRGLLLEQVPEPD